MAATHPLYPSVARCSSAVQLRDVAVAPNLEPLLAPQPVSVNSPAAPRSSFWEDLRHDCNLFCSEDLFGYPCLIFAVLLWLAICQCVAFLVYPASEDAADNFGIGFFVYGAGIPVGICCIYGAILLFDCLKRNWEDACFRLSRESRLC